MLIFLTTLEIFRNEFFTLDVLFTHSFQPHSPRDVSESKRQMWHLEESSNYPLWKEPSQLLNLKMERLQRRLNEKNTEVTKTYKVAY